MLIHGGGFRGGDKTSMRQYVEFSKYFASRGWAVFNLNYRLLKDYGSVPDKWKQMVDKEIININKNKLRINENYFNVHDYIVRKIIDNYLSS